MVAVNARKEYASGQLVQNQTAHQFHSSAEIKQKAPGNRGFYFLTISTGRAFLHEIKDWALVGWSTSDSSGSYVFTAEGRKWF
ncbi:hypothetical protein [Pelagibacterium mangrovi]|uniref:hypothetical protein n=1 Tax=Pelagibacterium mangrovi TaxID=3119828 RepID=UPI002FC87034